MEHKARNRILLLGDTTMSRYHSITEVEPLIKILEPFYEVIVSEDYPNIKKEDLNDFDLILNYIDNWEKRGNHKAEEALYHYFIEGGRILSIHGGIILDTSERLLGLHGAKFKGHEEYDLLTFIKSEKEHPITTDMESFSLHDEPYEFEFLPDKKLDVFLFFTLNGKRYPAGWTRREEKGKLVYFSFGHNKSTFMKEQIGTLVCKGIEWLLQS